MDQRDWELLDKQLRRSSPPQNDVIVSLTVAAVFLAGFAVGGILFAHENEPAQLPSNNAKVATYFPDGPTPSTSE